MDPLEFILSVPETQRLDLIPFGCAPGGYVYRCRDCQRRADGAKHSWRCEPCAVQVKAVYDADEDAHWEYIKGKATD